ncbi:MAG: hypothetical protein AAF570_21430, partial [Bacteroidota bacterium]
MDIGEITAFVLQAVKAVSADMCDLQDEAGHTLDAEMAYESVVGLNDRALRATDPGLLVAWYDALPEDGKYKSVKDRMRSLIAAAKASMYAAKLNDPEGLNRDYKNMAIGNTMSGDVGLKYGKRTPENAVKNVLMVQGRLFELGYLKESELLSERSDPPTYTQTEVKALGAAIKKFQGDMGTRKDGQVGSGGTTVQYLLTFVEKTSKKDAKDIQSARDKLSTKVHSGATALANYTLSGPVGNTTGNAPADVTAIQDALIAVGCMTERETAKPNAQGQIPKEKLPKTIAAINKFQGSRRKGGVAISSILNKSKMANEIGSNQHTGGIIKPGDGTLLVLQRYKKFSFTDDKKESYGKNSYKNMTLYNHRASVDGVKYDGNEKVTKDKLRGLDLSKTGSNPKGGKEDKLSEAQVDMVYHAAHVEGESFNNINSYDGADFSYGMIQFAGGKTRGLRPFMALMKHTDPATFDKHFKKYGIDVEYGMGKDGKVASSQLVIFDPAEGKQLRGAAAETYLFEHPELW